MKLAVIGGGSWGTALAHQFASKIQTVQLVVRQANVADFINTNHENPRYVRGLALHPNLYATANIAEALHGADIVLSVVPVQQTRSVLQNMKPLLAKNPIIVSASKGVEVGSLKTVGDMVSEELADISTSYAVLSGPSFAAEVVRGLPTAVVLGCENRELGAHLRDVLATPSFRTYSSTDVRGVELGGAFKNVIAIATGLSDGLGCGDNARAGLITRGLAEMSRLGIALGAQAPTFMGLSGLGDLALTCTGDLSRNRQVGLGLAQGRTLNAIIDGMGMVAEGVKTTEAVYALAQKLAIDLPITSIMYGVLHHNRDPRAEVTGLMTRALREE